MSDTEHRSETRQLREHIAWAIQNGQDVLPEDRVPPTPFALAAADSVLGDLGFHLVGYWQHGDMRERPCGASGCRDERPDPVYRLSLSQSQSGRHIAGGGE